MKTPKNIAASVRQRLFNQAKNDRRPFQELLQHYAMERFLYRLSQSEQANRFILKGALLLKVWGAPDHRPTMDIDLLGKTSNKKEEIVARIQSIVAVEVAADGLTFDVDSLQTEPITEWADYLGFRIRFPALLNPAKISIQIVIGFGDIVYPQPEKWELPTILDDPPPRILCYSKESAIAEKLEAMVKLGSLNSRMKDIFDIWLLSRSFNFEGARLSEAIRQTFSHRGTNLPESIHAFTTPYFIAKQGQWLAFRNRLGKERIPTSFQEVGGAVAEFLQPMVERALFNKKSPNLWVAAESWT